MIDAELLNEKFDFELSKVFVGFLAKVEKFDKSKMEAKVKPLIKIEGKDGFLDLPIVTLPVKEYYGNGCHIVPDFKSGEIVECKGNIYPIDSQLKGQIEIAGPIRFNLANCSIIGGHPKRPFTLPSSLQKDGLVICHESGNVYLNLTDSQIDCKVNDTKMLLKSTGVEITGDVKITGKLEVTKTSKFNDNMEIAGTLDVTNDITSDTEVVAGTTQVKLSKHGHTTVLGPTIPPVIPMLG